MENSSSSSIIPPTSDVIVLFIISITFERYNKNRSYESISLLAVLHGELHSPHPLCTFRSRKPVVLLVILNGTSVRRLCVPAPIFTPSISPRLIWLLFSPV